MVQSPPQANSPDSTARQLAGETFVLAFPLILMDAIRRAHPLAVTRFRRFPREAHQLLPNLFHDDPDCLHTCAVMDLGLSPCVLHLPNTHGRYLSVTLFDAAGEAFASLGSRTDDHLVSDAVIAGPGWRGEVRPDLRAYRSPSDQVWAISRILGRSATDQPIVESLAARQHLSFTHSGMDQDQADASAAKARLDVLDLTAVRQIAAIEPRTLFHRLIQLIDRAPRPTQDELGLALRGRLSLMQAQAETNAQTEEAMARGFGDGWKAIQEARAALLAPPSGAWSSEDRLPDGLSATARAALIWQRLGAPLREDVLTMRCNADESNRHLCGEELYRIRLSASGLPPAHSAWRLTAHAPQTCAAGGLVGDHTPLLVGESGALELLVQRDPPARQLAANWLRAPPGRFELKLRLYGPGAEALSGVWRMPAVERLGSRGDARAETPGRPATRNSPRPPRGPRPPSSTGSTTV